MALKSRHISFALLFLLAALACSGIVVDPPANPTPAPTQAPAPGPTPLPTSDLPIPDDLEIVTVANVVDGDTIELEDGRRVRYIGINTPERDQPYYNEATTANRQLVGGLRVGLETDQETFDQYGRTLAYVWANGQMVNLEIVRRGFANAYTVPPNVRYQEKFQQAEREARENERGLWAGSDIELKIIQIQADAPGSDRENPNGEWVEIANQSSQPVQMQGYTLKDEANHIYTFGNFTVQPEAKFRLYSGQGQDSETELYWGLSGESIWNNGGDTAFLRDTQGALVDTYAY